MSETITKEQLVAYEKKVVTECLEKINALLDEYGCDLIAVPQIAPDGRITAVLQLKMSK